MSYYDGEIPGDSEFKSTIAEGLIEAEHANENHFSQFETSCGKDQYIRNLRNQIIAAKLPIERYCSKVFMKNRWSYMVILDGQDDCLNVLLNKNNFRELVIHPIRKQKHYAKYPALRNADLDQYDTILERPMLYGWKDNELDEGVMEHRHEELLKLESAFKKGFKRYVIITFKPDKDLGISSLTANLVDSQFQLKKQNHGMISFLSCVPMICGRMARTHQQVVHCLYLKQSVLIVSQFPRLFLSRTMRMNNK